MLKREGRPEIYKILTSYHTLVLRVFPAIFHIKKAKNPLDKGVLTTFFTIQDGETCCTVLEFAKAPGVRN